MAGPTNAELKVSLAVAQAELETFKKKVKERVIEAIDSGEICETGYEVLEQWGIPAERKYTVTYTLTVIAEGVPGTPGSYGEVDTENTDEAVYEKVKSALENLSLDNGVTVRLDDIDVYEIEPES